MNTKRVVVVLAAAAIAFASVRTSRAVTIVTTIPGGATEQTPGQSPQSFIADFYEYALAVAGILAFGIIVYGGVRYMMSAGNPSARTDAKEWIEAALLGILLLAGAYLILYIVNPNLVSLNLPGLQSSGAPASGSGSGNSSSSGSGFQGFGGGQTGGGGAGGSWGD